MNNHERKQRILDLLKRHQKLTVPALEESLNASPATIRRDLSDLQQRGLVLRVHGGVLHPDYLAGEPTWDVRSRESIAEKQRIAQKAAALVEGRASVFIDAGTTALQVGRLLLLRNDVTLYTVSLPMVELAKTSNAPVICLGGEYRHTTKTFVGALTMSWMANLHFNFAFLGGAGLSPNEGVSTTELREAAVKQEAMRRAQTNVLVSDASKWNRPSAVRFADWKDFDIWVTDSPTDAPEIGAPDLEIVTVNDNYETDSQ